MFNRFLTWLKGDLSSVMQGPDAASHDAWVARNNARIAAQDAENEAARVETGATVSTLIVVLGCMITIAVVVRAVARGCDHPAILGICVAAVAAWLFIATKRPAIGEVPAVNLEKVF